MPTTKIENSDETLVPVNNLPSNYTDYAWLTVRHVDGEFWFYGTWQNNIRSNADAFRLAVEQALKINGIVVPTSLIRRGEK